MTQILCIPKTKNPYIQKQNTNGKLRKRIPYCKKKTKQKNAPDVLAKKNRW